jgi:hypothetical protein
MEIAAHTVALFRYSGVGAPPCAFFLMNNTFGCSPRIKNSSWLGMKRVGVFLLGMGARAAHPVSISMEAMSNFEYDSGIVGTLTESAGFMIITDAIDSSLVKSLSESLASCLRSEDAQSMDIHESRILDGSRRSTFANIASHGFTQCGEATQRLVASYNAVLQDIGVKVAAFIDVILADRFGTLPRSIVDLIHEDALSSTLDHYHIYSEDDSSSPSGGLRHSAGHSVPMHVDKGLFLLLSPGLWIDETGVMKTELSSLMVESVDGTVTNVSPQYTGGKSPLLVLLGAGISQWMYPGLGIRACHHAVGSMAGAGADRVMLGRMYLPSPRTVSPSGELFSRFFMDSHGDTSQWRRLLEERCEQGTKYCWMDCMPEVDCGGSESVCKDPTTDEICLETDCNENCQLMCPVEPTVLVADDVTTAAPISPRAVPVVAAASPTGFCRGGTSMVMSGFESVTTENANCIILFFRPWLLDSATKFAIGCIGVFLLGMLIEAVIRLRRRIGGMKSIHGSKVMKEILVVFLFAINVSLGYLGMLAAMTFNVEIFVSIVAGLATGHVVFANAKAPVRETADPCCVTTEFPGEVSTSLRNATGACCCEPMRD